jgi:hypothetical protein
MTTLLKQNIYKHISLSKEDTENFSTKVNQQKGLFI